ncbi:MAG: hypothetical protein IPO00_03795 [Betaproteobacteria bacterium]|nr:hypothetical protein [Betaproteobacteria bacterium]
MSAGTATGGDGNDTLANIEGVRGSAHNDTITGSANGNYLQGMAGNDFLDGGLGDDRADYDKATAGVNVNLATGSAIGNASVGTDTLVSIEGVRGSGFADTLTAVGGSGDYSFEGREGNDTITGGSQIDEVVLHLQG